MKKFLMVVACIAFGAILAGNAMAMTISGVDFRTWGGAYGNASYTVGNVTASASGGDGKLYQDDKDGLGVLGGEPDEINSGETLTVTIGDNGMYLKGVWLTDIFLSDNPAGTSPSEDYKGISPTGEPGTVELNDGAYTFDFFGNQVNTGETGLNGELWVPFNGCLLVNKLEFNVRPDASGSYAGIEYSVAGLESCVVPEPATMLLLGFGLAGLAGVRMRRKN